jgi:hypothetical protein
MIPGKGAPLRVPKQSHAVPTDSAFQSHIHSSYDLQGMPVPACSQAHLPLPPIQALLVDYLHASPTLGPPQSFLM